MWKNTANTTILKHNNPSALLYIFRRKFKHVINIKIIFSIQFSFAKGISLNNFK